MSLRKEACEGCRSMCLETDMRHGKRLCITCLSAEIRRLDAEVRELRHSNEMACEEPCGTCAGCKAAEAFHVGRPV